ncbi:BlaR1 family beta-lactam sensor/signal transducer [Heyndrickxia oleronia]|uniref:BlaR1 family beta-lactam sensor/signal transducer n=1 Tax=Heyndrickxia oleronia TaxID=38875 RepID=UPI003F25D527
MMGTSILRFLLSVLVVSLLILIILLIKKVLKKHMSQQVHYKIWYFLFIPLITFIFPWNFLQVGEKLEYIKSLLSFNTNTTPKHKQLSAVQPSETVNNNLIHDFTLSVNKKTPDFFNHTFIVCWVIGMIFFLGVALYANYQISKMKKVATTIHDQKTNELLEACKKVVGVKRNIIVQESSLITSPITLGILQPYIFLPHKTLEEFSLKKLKYVFLHELSHHKRKDVFINYVMWAFQIIYWFNPLVWIALKRMRIDRELACDASVLNLLDESGYIEYGYTIIEYADKKHNYAFGQFSSGIGGTKQQIKQRIQNIANYTGDSKLMKWKDKLIYICLGIIVVLPSSFISATASSDDVYHFNEKNAIYENLSSYFDNYQGSFVLFDSANKQYRIYNREMSKQRVSPDSTYKIYSALFALESNVISPRRNKQIWDGTVYPIKEWNTNQNLSTALQNSVNWYFQHLDQKVGKKQLQSNFHKINYGNEDLSGGLDNYWIESSLKISPIEQVQLLYALGENRLGFKEENIHAVKKALFIDKKNQGQLYGKTGTGKVNGKNINGWFIGFVKKNNHSYYFAINIQNKNGHATGKKAAEIARRILKDQHIF